MTQVIITQAENGFVVEVRLNGTTEIQIAANLAQVSKIIKATYNKVEEDEIPF